MRVPTPTAIVLALSLIGAALRAEPSIPVGATVASATFHARLAPYGSWVRVAKFSDEVWIPADVPAGWRPYSDGQWVMTEYGWTFISGDAPGEVVWHYGNWMLTDDAGWAWAPGNTWAPAWVSWRTGEGYAAWAPLPPERARLAVYPPASPAWVCVREDQLTRPLAEVTLPLSESIPRVQRAQPLAKLVRADGLGVNPGPRGEAIAAATGEPVRAVSSRAVIGDGGRSLGSVPSAPRASPLVIQAMRAAWSQEPPDRLHANQSPGALRRRGAEGPRSLGGGRPAARERAKGGASGAAAEPRERRHAAARRGARGRSSASDSPGREARSSGSAGRDRARLREARRAEEAAEVAGAQAQAGEIGRAFGSVGRRGAARVLSGRRAVHGDVHGERNGGPLVYLSS
jgi:hypothetical protein